MIKNPNQLEINFSEDVNKKPEIIKEEFDEKDGPGWDLYKKYDEIEKEKAKEKEKKDRRSLEYIEMKKALNKSKENTIERINNICGQGIDLKLPDGFKKVSNLKNSWQKQNDYRAIELGRLMGKLTVLRKICKLYSQDLNKCLVSLEALKIKHGVGANEIVLSSNFPKLIDLVKKEIK